jgi:hypothetical protein
VGFEVIFYFYSWCFISSWHRKLILLLHACNVQDGSSVPSNHRHQDCTVYELHTTESTDYVVTDMVQIIGRERFNMAISYEAKQACSLSFFISGHCGGHSASIGSDGPSRAIG